MTTKKTNKEIVDNKTDGCSDKECQKNFYYDYYTYNNNYIKEEKRKSPILVLTERGKRIVQTISEISIGICIGLAFFAVISTYLSVKNLEKVLDKKAAPVHTSPSTTKPHTK